MDHAADAVREVVSRHGLWMTWNTFLALVPLGLALVLFRDATRTTYGVLLSAASVVGVAVLAGASFMWRLGILGVVPLLVGALALAGIALLLDRTLVPGRPWLSPVWWAGIVLFLLFLPNAPYVLTDLVHLVEDIDSGLFTRRVVLTVLVPIYGMFCLVGFEAFTLSLLSLRGFLGRRGLISWAAPAELCLCFLCAVGIFLGRHLRFNSWDAFHDPYRVAEESARQLAAQRGTLFVLGMFVVITALYAVFALVHRGGAALIRRVRSRRVSRRAEVAAA